MSLLLRKRNEFVTTAAFIAVLQLYCTVMVTAAPKYSKCKEMRRESFKKAGSFTPRCNSDGSFAKRQCYYTTVYVRCWEVDKDGRKTSTKDTLFQLTQPNRILKTRPASTNIVTTHTSQPLTNHVTTFTDSITDAGGSEIVETKPNDVSTSTPAVGKPLTRCQRLRLHRQRRRKRLSSVIPQCTRDGHFKKEQCTRGRKKCWCVNEKGKRIPGTKVHNKRPKCYHDFCGKRFNKRTSRPRRVIGGREATRNTWPWQALVLFSDPKHICGGTLVKRNWLVTSASCFDGVTKRKSEWNVRLGAHRLTSDDRDRISVKAIHIHPKYKPGNKTHPGDYDVALLQVSSSARIPTNTWPLCLPDDTSFYRKGARCSITGWGLTSNNGTRATALQEAWVDLVPLNECNSKKSYNGTINDRFMCAGFKEGGVDACHFDTGGPLACPVNGGVWALAGIVSWRQSCAQPHKYGVYTNVHVIKPWIHKIIRR